MKICKSCKYVSSEDKKLVEEQDKERRKKLRDSTFLLGLYMIFQRAEVKFFFSGLNDNGEIKEKVIDVVVEGIGKKIKIFIDHLRNGEISIKDEIEFEEDWLVLVGGYSEKNNVGLVLKGCEGEEVSEYLEPTRSKGFGRRLRVDSMKMMNLERRLKTVTF